MKDLDLVQRLTLARGQSAIGIKLIAELLRCGNREMAVRLVTKGRKEMTAGVSQRLAFEAIERKDDGFALVP